MTVPSVVAIGSLTAADRQAERDLVHFRAHADIGQRAIRAR